MKGGKFANGNNDKPNGIGGEIRQVDTSMASDDEKREPFDIKLNQWLTRNFRTAKAFEIDGRLYIGPDFRRES